MKMPILKKAGLESKYRCSNGTGGILRPLGVEHTCRNCGAVFVTYIYDNVCGEDNYNFYICPWCLDGDYYDD